jgi:hypothetical protein
MHAPTPVHADDASFAHQASNTLLTHMLTCFAQIYPDSWRSVRAVRARVARLNLNGEICIVLRVSREWSLRPRVESTAGESEHATHRRDRELGLVIPHEPESSLDSFGIVPVSRANQAAAFDSISRSSFS